VSEETTTFPAESTSPDVAPPAQPFVAPLDSGGGQKPATRQVAGVRFYAVGKIYHFDATDYPDLGVGDLVIVTTTRGRQVGQVASVGPQNGSVAQGPLKPIERRATGRDLAIRKHWENKELEALITARELNNEVGLPIKLIRAEYSFDGKQLTLLYSAEERKDTKALRRRLARAFRAKIELRQIGPRDVAKILGGYGACGGPRCCSTFLTEFSPISIRMAKAQGISLNPTEITGMCGRLRCCLVYEFEQYLEARKHLPKQGKRVGTPHGEGRVVSLLPLKEVALIDLGERTVEVHREDIVPLEEWRALQEKAAQPCDHGETCTCGAKKPAPPPEPEPKPRREPTQPGLRAEPQAEGSAQALHRDRTARRGERPSPPVHAETPRTQPRPHRSDDKPRPDKSDDKPRSEPSRPKSEHKPRSSRRRRRR
jgi:cell fate regulator YaaT (PSP1 superfamily)